MTTARATTSSMIEPPRRVEFFPASRRRRCASGFTETSPGCVNLRRTVVAIRLAETYPSIRASAEIAPRNLGFCKAGKRFPRARRAALPFRSLALRRLPRSHAVPRVTARVGRIEAAVELVAVERAVGVAVGPLAPLAAARHGGDGERCARRHGGEQRVEREALRAAVGLEATVGRVIEAAVEPRDADPRHERDVPLIGLGDERREQ